MDLLIAETQGALSVQKGVFLANPSVRKKERKMGKCELQGPNTFRDW